jgi:hypothetical protein
MAVTTVKQLCKTSSSVANDTLVEQVAQLEDLASTKIDAAKFFRRNHFTERLRRLVERGFERLAGQADDGAFYLTQAMGGGKTHSLLAFGLLAQDPDLRRKVVPDIAARTDFAAAKVVIFSGHHGSDGCNWRIVRLFSDWLCCRVPNPDRRE